MLGLQPTLKRSQRRQNGRFDMNFTLFPVQDNFFKSSNVIPHVPGRLFPNCRLSSRRPNLNIPMVDRDCPLTQPPHTKPHVARQPPSNRRISIFTTDANHTAPRPPTI